MSDLLWLWSEGQEWGGPAERLVMMSVCRETVEPERIAYVTEDILAAYAEIPVARCRRVLSRLIASGHVVRVVSREGPALMVGAVWRREPITVRFGAL